MHTHTHIRNLRTDYSQFVNLLTVFLFSCAIIHCNLPDQWQHIAMSWLSEAYSEYAVKQAYIEIWRDMILELVPKALVFLSERQSSVLREGTTYFEKVCFIC